MIRVEQLTGGYGKKPIVQGIDLEIRKGEFFALLGPNGSGKTTLFKLITGQLPASSGDIFIAGKAMSKLTKLEKAKKVAVLSQEVQMTFDYTVEEIINLGRYPHQKGVLKMLSAYDRQVIDTVMEITKVERYRKTQFRLLSGGEKQRVLLAKALAQEPEILLLDEPTNHLDIKHTFQMLDLLKEWQQTKGLTVFAILHDLNVASLYADRVALLHEGSFLEVGDVNTLRKEQQLKKVYEVEVKTQAHPLVAKPQLHLTPAQSYVPDIMPLLESYQFERKERVAHLQFNQPLRALSNASVGAGMQWLQYFCFVADFSEGTETPLLARLENHGISPEQAAAVGFKGDVQDIVFSERRVAGVPVFIVAVIEVNDDTPKNVDAIHLMLVVDNHLQDKALLDWYMVVTEAKVKACQRLKLQSVQSAKDVLLIASTQGASQPRHSEIGEAFRTGIEQAVFDVIEEGVLKVRYTIKTRMGDNYMSENKNSRRGLTLVYTGHGKGKTTAALGLALRSIGRGYQVKILQFIKSPQRSYGEQIALKKLGVGMEQLGIGFTWLKTPEEHREALKKAWPQARDAVMSGEYDVVILDELNNALAIDKFPIEDVLPLDEILETIKNRPSHVHLVITGRDALPEIKEIADLVSVIEPEKHYYDDGVEAVKGLEF